MTVDELLDDLDERINNGITHLESIACDIESDRNYRQSDVLRLRAKAEGLHTVRDWLRSYRTPENVDGP